MIKNVTMGSDAEIFLRSKADGSVFPVCGLVGGTKDKPKSMGGQGYYVQEDNVLLEFNIPVCKTKKDFCVAIYEALRRARRLIPPSLEAAVLASGNINKAFLSIDQACVFGCEPDFNAWQRTVKPRPYAEDETFRTAAAHVHIGWDNPTDHERHELIKAADLFVVLPSLWEDKDTERRKLYGKAGAFRIKEYGVEHRVLSNYWIADPVFTEYVWDRYQRAIKFVNSGFVIPDVDGAIIQRAINENSKELARPLVAKYKLL